PPQNPFSAGGRRRPAAVSWHIRRTPARRCRADWTARAGFPWWSFRLDPRFFHDAAPFFDLGPDHFAELLGRAALDLDARAGEPRAHVILLERGIDRSVQLRHHVLRRARGRQDP